MQVTPIGMTGTGELEIRCATQATRASSAAASRSSGGRASGRLSPANSTRSRPGSPTAASSAWSTGVSTEVRLLASTYPVASSGLRTVANDGMCGAIASTVAAANGGMSRPCAAGPVSDQVAGAAGHGQHAHAAAGHRA